MTQQAGIKQTQMFLGHYYDKQKHMDSRGQSLNQYRKNTDRIDLTK